MTIKNILNANIIYDEIYHAPGFDMPYLGNEKEIKKKYYIRNILSFLSFFLWLLLLFVAFQFYKPNTLLEEFLCCSFAMISTSFAIVSFIEIIIMSSCKAQINCLDSIYKLFSFYDDIKDNVNQIVIAKNYKARHLIFINKEDSTQLYIYKFPYVNSGKLITNQNNDNDIIVISTTICEDKNKEITRLDRKKALFNLGSLTSSIFKFSK